MCLECTGSAATLDPLTGRCTCPSGLSFDPDTNVCSECRVIGCSACSYFSIDVCETCSGDNVLVNDSLFVQENGKCSCLDSSLTMNFNGICEPCDVEYC